MNTTPSINLSTSEIPQELQDCIVQEQNNYIMRFENEEQKKIAFEKVLIYYSNTYGLTLTQNICEQLYSHYRLLVEKNKYINLTRITEPLSACILHYLDSLLLMQAPHKFSTDSCFLDIGCGAGFPGIPLGIYTHAQGTLIDSVGKKVSCVKEFINELQINNLHAQHVRAEALALDKPHTFDVVVCRAVAALPTLIEYATPLLKKNGILICAKSNKTNDELTTSKHARELCGLEYVSRETYELPLGFGHREVLMFKKTKTATIKLPRNTGMAQHKPL